MTVKNAEKLVVCQSVKAFDGGHFLCFSARRHHQRGIVTVKNFTNNRFATMRYVI